MAESAVKSVKILLGKSIEEKSNYPEMLYHFNQAPREDGYLPSKLFNGRRVRSYFPTLDDAVDINKGKAATEMKGLLVKNPSQTHKPLKPLNVGDLCYKRCFDWKKPVRIKSLCEVIVIRKNGESYYIIDLESERVYLRNRMWIEPSETSLNQIHRARSLKFVCDKSTSHHIDNGNLSRTSMEIPQGFQRTKHSEPPNKRVKFDNMMILARC